MTSCSWKLLWILPACKGRFFLLIDINYKWWDRADLWLYVFTIAFVYITEFPFWSISTRFKKNHSSLIGCTSLRWSGSGSVIRDHWDHEDQMNRWIHSGQGFIGSFDPSWSEWSRITDPDPVHLKGTHHNVLCFRVSMYLVLVLHVMAS